MEEAPHLSSFGRTGKRKEKPSLCVRESVGSPTSDEHDPIEVNIYEGTFLLLQGLLVGGERGSKNINICYFSFLNTYVLRVSSCLLRFI